MGKIREKLVAFKKGVLTQRVWLRGSFFEYLIVLAIFIALTVIYTNFIAFHITTKVFANYPGDGTGGFMWYNFAEPGLSLFLSPSNMVNYPFGEAIGGPTFITYMAIWIPMRLLSFVFGVVAGANLFMLLGYLLSAMSMYWLVKRLTNNIAVSIFAAFAGTFAPYTIAKSFDQVPYILSYVFIFIIAAFIAVWKRPTKLRAAIFGIAIAVAFYTDGYYLLLASVLVTCLCAAGFLYSLIMKAGWGFVWPRIKVLLVSLVCLLILITPILHLQLASGSQIKQSLAGRRSSIASEFKLYRTHLMDLIVPAYNNPFLVHNKEFSIIQSYKNNRSNPSENTNYIGFVILLLCGVATAFGAVWLFGRRYSSLRLLAEDQQQNFILITCVAVVCIPVMLSFMFSPSVHFLGYNIPLPGQFFIDHNISLWRVPSRFFVPLHVVFVLFSAIGLWVALGSLGILKKRSNWRSFVAWTIVICLTVLLAAEYATAFNRPSYDISTVAKGYYWLRQQTNIKVVGELPVVDPLDHRTADYVTDQIIHGKKIINSKESTDSSLTDVLGDINNPETVDWAYQRGAQALITHYERCVDVPWGRLLFRDDKDVENAMCVYSLDHPVTQDKEFIKFDSGFLHRPNATNQDVIIFSDTSATLEVTDDRFATSKQPGMANISFTLGGRTGQVNQGEWDIMQNGKILSSGDINSLGTQLSANVDVRYQVQVKLVLTDKHIINPGEYILTNSTATNS